MQHKIINALTSFRFWGIAFMPALLAFIAILIIARDPRILNLNYELNSNSLEQNQGEFMSIGSCLDLPWEEQNGCFDQFMDSFGENKEIVAILADLEQARAVDDRFENNCHPIAHSVGRLSLTRYGNVGDAFQACDFTCHSGCYHGVMERMFYDDNEILNGAQHLSLEQLRTKVPGICDRDKFTDPTQSLIFQCLHGVGHAILYTMDYDLLEALKGCDLLADNYERSSCYGGVVMENVTAFDRAKRYIRQGDPHYPCNILDEKYQYDCYQMQTSVMAEVGVGAEDQGKECLGAGNESNIHACHVSVGRDLSNFVRSGQVDYVAKVCQQDVSENYTSHCMAGAIYALIDNTWDAKYAYQLCNALRSENQLECYQLANGYIDLYSHNFDSKQGQCAKYAGKNEGMCLESI